MAEPTDSITPEATERDAAADPLELELPPSGSVAPTAGTARHPVAAPAERVRSNGRPESSAEMRREIDRTRARISDTLDALEARVVHEKRALERTRDAVWSRVTLRGVRRKLSREPWRSVAIAFAAGYIIAAIRD
ncbi:MAG: DUF3618 domain-containing protein [Gemmatimonadetes bacterium]|nr:DUF3618 domain-containing protein [Gemmatimonadota bacterium]NIR41450.1 DUF3618 domain-containing protein [Actinomycetota bacterium]NIU79544.1 DUF3618 domain-containing protein [Gammaproteobacteria bacterium]NIQ59353.1 DUF3618 domain-containing protein [Gemmatimonadota bacterium]NIX48166.1 DUF3618 domain-containing protein [Gemmatimonadota bacterium]